MGTIREVRPYQECSLNQDDVIVVMKNFDIEIYKVKKVLDKTLDGTKYIFARDLKKHFKKLKEDYDEQFEVVEDGSKTYNVNINEIIGKSTIIYQEGTEHHSIETGYYICRFLLKGNQLFPVNSSVLTEKSLNSPIIKSDFKNTNIMGIENTPITNVYNNIEIHLENVFSPPRQRNSVKRDLNKSFGNSPPSKNDSILNYSIIKDDESADIKIKLRVSNKRNGQTTESPRSPPKIRKSNRSISRKSYADYISPVKRSPNKRQYSRSRRESDDELDSRQKSAAKRTPRKQPRSENSTPTKKENRTPNRDNTDLSSLYKRTPRGTPARRSLRLTSAETDSSPRSVRSTRKNIAEEDLGVTSLGTNLDDSLRRQTLKGNFERIKVVKNKIIDFNDESDDDQKINLCKEMRIHLPNLNLTNSSEEDSDESDSDNIFESTPTKSKSTIKTKKQMDTPERKKNLNSRGTPTKTPKSKSVSKSSKSETLKTPKNRAKLIRDGVVTPSMHERSTKIKGESTPLMKARSKLHVSYVPESLPCREKEYCDVYNFVEGKLLDGCGGCMYVSGVPGTGKTATVTSVISHLQGNKKIPKFTFVNVNGMRLSEPRQSYVEILKQLKGITRSWEQAQNILEDTFVKQKKMAPTVMLIDELDILCTKRQDVVYNLLDWPTKAKNQLIVITIANTMDLPERLLMNRVTSRLGLTRLTFQAYTYKQLQEIVSKRLCGTNSFNSDAVQFVARKVASVSGDARRALDICRRAAEIAEAHGKEQLVTMSHVNEALNAMITQPKVLAIKSCSRLEQLILQSTVAEVERTGVEETTFCDIYKMLSTCGGIEGFKMVSPTLAQSAMARLSACRLVLADQKCNNIYQKIILNVSVDDVYYALKTN